MSIRDAFRGVFIAAMFGVICAAAAASPAWDPDVDDDFDWVTIGAPGNPPYDGPTSGFTPQYPTGNVTYLYRMTRTEISAEQWLEFANAFGPLGDPFRIGRDAFEIEPVIGTGPGFYIFQYSPGAEMHLAAVSGVTWRNAARYCNWLHNGKEVSLEALETGAYDTTTFGEAPCYPDAPINCFTDADAHLPGARYWIPTLDEWMKAVYYDPDHGWRLYPDGGDEPLLPGPATNPDAETNTAYEGPDEAFSYRIGRYPHVQTPWGLLDASGGVSEWIEDVQAFSGIIRTNRMLVGSHRGELQGLHIDRADVIGVLRPDFSFPDTGLRLASQVELQPSADLNSNGQVDFADLNAVLIAWGTSAGDLTGDGSTGFDDLTLVLNQWGCPIHKN